MIQSEREKFKLHLGMNRKSGLLGQKEAITALSECGKKA